MTIFRNKYFNINIYKIGLVSFIILITGSKAFSQTQKGINKIEIYGNKRISNEALLDHFGLQIGDKVQKSDINYSLKKIYQLGLFSDIQINLTENNDTFDINISLSENPTINEVIFNGNKQFEKDNIIKELATQVNRSYSKEKLKTDLDRLYALYQKMGYLNVYINPKVVFLNDNKVDIVFNINEGMPSKVDEIILIGNKNFYDFTLKDILLSKESMILNPFSNRDKFEEEKLVNDKNTLVEFYMNNGYANCKIHNPIATFNKENMNFLITFFIEEGDIYNFGNISIQNNSTYNKINNIIDNAEYATFATGEIFSKESINKTIDRIKTILSQNGYTFLNIDYKTTINKETKTVDVKFIINKAKMAYINRINISGNTTTKHQVILRELMINEGDLYDIDKIKLSKDRLYMLGYFKKVDFKEKVQDSSDLIDIDIEVEEQFFGTANFSIGYSSFEGIIGMVQASVNNILGYGYSGSVGFSRSGFMESYNLGLYDPYFIQNYNIGLGFNAFYSRFGDLGGGTRYTQNIPYQGQTFGFNINSGFEIINRLTYNVDIGVMFSMNRMNMLLYESYSQLVGNRSSYSFGHSITWNQTNRARYATSGYLLKYTERYGTGLFNSQQFITRILNGIVYIPFFQDNLILHLSAEAGFAQKTGDKQIGIENLWTMGYHKMRGFSFFGLGPRIGIINPDGNVMYMPYAVQAMNYYIFTAELQSPLFLPKEYGIKFATFIDVGSIWGFPGSQTVTQRSDCRTEQIFDSASVRMSVGVGMIWESPMGEIRFDFAKPIIKEVYDTPMQFNIRFGSINF